MPSFDTIARRVVVEAHLGDSGLSPEYVFLAWLRSRYRQIIDRLQHSDINRQNTVAFATEAPQSNGTVTVIHGSPLVTGLGTGFITPNVGQYFRVNSKRNWYRIIAVASATQLTLDTPYTEENAVGIAYTIAQRYYTPPSGVRWITDVKLPQRHTLYELDQTKLNEMFPSREAHVSVPQYWSPSGWNGEQRTLEFYPFADKQYRIEIVGYTNLSEPTLASSPEGDINDRILIEGALADAMRYRAALPGLEAPQVQALLILAGAHEKQFALLLQDMMRRSSLDKPQPQLELAFGANYAGRTRDIMTAEDEVWR